MGLRGVVGRVLSFVRVDTNGVKTSDVQFDPGGGATITGKHFSAPGDDAQPLADDYLATVPSPRSGGKDVVGYIDTVNEGEAGPGEKRMYARDSSGAIVASVFIKSDGAVVVENQALGKIELQADGIVTMNLVTIDLAGNIVTPGTITAAAISAGAIATSGAGGSIESPSIKAAGKELAEHTHPFVGLPNGTPGNTAPNS